MIFTNECFLGAHSAGPVSTTQGVGSPFVIGFKLRPLWGRASDERQAARFQAQSQRSLTRAHARSRRTVKIMNGRPPPRALLCAFGLLLPPDPQPLPPTIRATSDLLSGHHRWVRIFRIFHKRIYPTQALRCLGSDRGLTPSHRRVPGHSTNGADSCVRSLLPSVGLIPASGSKRSCCKRLPEWAS